MNKKIFASVLAVAMLASFATSCGGSTSSSSTGSSSTSSASSSASSSTDSTGSDDGSYFQMTEEGYPVLNEPVTVSVVSFGTLPDGVDVTWETPNDMWFFQTQAERTGISFEWDHMSADAWKEKVPIMIAGDDLPDVFLKSRFTDGELTKYGDQGLFVNIEPLIEEYAPDLYSFVSERDLLKYMKLGTGIWGMPYLYDSEAIRMSKIFFNVDWLEAVGKDMPTSWDEIYDVCAAFRDGDPNGNGDTTDEIPFGADGINELLAMMSGEFGLMNRGSSMGYSLYLDADPADASGNTLRFWPAADEAKDLLKLAKKFYQDGLLASSFFDSDYGTIFYDAAENNQIGCHDLWATATGIYVDSYISMDRAPSDLWTCSTGYLGTKGGLVITKECPIPEAMVGWGNYMYTTQGAYDYFLGKEGESYIINDEGHTELTDLVTVDHNGSMSNFTLFPGGANPGLLTDDTFKGGETYWTSLEGNAKFDPYLPEVIWEKFPLTTEESDIINNAKGDIDAVFKEYTAYFITGQLDIDADWQAYLDKLNAAGLENYMKAYQEAYDNLNANA